VSYKTKKIFDANTPNANDVWKPICIVNSELHCNQNDSYMPWQIGNDGKFGSGGGHITEDESKAISDWLLSEGGEADENVLIWISW